jgi:hypothetical protein
MALDLTGDFAYVDNLEEVTLTALDATTQDVAGAFSTELRTREIEASNGRYTAGDRRFHLPDANVTGTPNVGGTIEDADFVYTILDVSHAAMSGIWKLAARKLAIYEELNTLVTVQVATWAKNANGVQAATWADEATNVRAKIQPATDQIEDDENARNFRKRFTIYLAEERTINHDRRIIGPDSKVYKVLSYQGRERLDQLPKVLVELVP